LTDHDGIVIIQSWLHLSTCLGTSMGHPHSMVP